MIIFMGVSGAGKGTQSQLLIDKVGYGYVSTGDILRTYATPGQRERMLDGYWLSDDEIITIVDKALSAMPNPDKTVLDGFPRTQAQADWLISQTQKGTIHIEAIFNLLVAPQDVQDRLHARHRIDDTDAAIEHRIKEYEHFTRPLLDQFRHSGFQVYDIDGSRSPDKVHDEVLAKLKK